MTNKRLLVSALLLITLTSCGKKSAPENTEAVQTDLNQVVATEALLAQVKIEAISTTPISDTLRVAGRIDFDERNLTRVGSSVTGRISNLGAHLGQHVRKGDVLATLHSTELSSAQLAYLKAKAQMELTRRNAERAKSLFDADVISAAERQRRENEFQVASAEVRAATDQLLALGLPEKMIERLGQSGVINSSMPLTSTLEGVLVERKVSQGQVVQPSDHLFVVANLGRLWAVAQVPEQQIEHVKVGQDVTIEVPALNHAPLVGKLIYVGQIVNPETRTVLVRTELDNTQGHLKPAMLASMVIQSKPVPRLFVPSSAVVREEDEDFVYLQLAPNRFRLTRVKLSSEQNGKRIVLDGVKAGDQVVTEGAFHLNNERMRQLTEGDAATAGRS